MAPYSSILAWKISWTKDPGRLQSLVSQRVGHDWAHTHTHAQYLQVIHIIYVFEVYVLYIYIYVYIMSFIFFHIHIETYAHIHTNIAFLSFFTFCLFIHWILRTSTHFFQIFWLYMFYDY